MRTMYILGTDDRPTNWPTDLAFWKISNGHILAMGHPIHFMFGSRIGFSETAERMDLLLVGPNPRWWLSIGHISGTGRPIDFMFHPSVGFYGDGGSNGPTSGWTKSKIRPPAILENFEWPYLWNELSDPLSWITEQRWRNTGENNAED